MSRQENDPDPGVKEVRHGVQLEKVGKLLVLGVSPEELGLGHGIVNLITDLSALESTVIHKDHSGQS